MRWSWCLFAYGIKNIILWSFASENSLWIYKERNHCFVHVLDSRPRVKCIAAVFAVLDRISSEGAQHPAPPGYGSLYIYKYMLLILSSTHIAPIKYSGRPSDSHMVGMYNRQWHWRLDGDDDDDDDNNVVDEKSPTK